MATNEVIANLVRELRPLAPLPLPRTRTLWWAAASALITLGAVSAIGLRADLGSAATTPSFQMHALFLLVAAWGSAAAALTAAVPGEPLSRSRQTAPLIALSGWCLWIGAELGWLAAAGGAWWPVAAGWGCVAKSFAVGFLPAALLIMMIAKAAPPDLRRTGLFAGLSGAAVGAFGVEMTCPIVNPAHLLLWHAGPAVAIVAVAALFNRGASRAWQ